MNTTAPYEAVYAYHEDDFALERQLSIVSLQAQTVGIRNFKKLFVEYTKSLKRAANDIYICNNTNFEGQPIELEAGEWQADDYGVTRHNGMYEEQACCHPILPVERLVNIDTGVEKLKIAFSKGRKWREIIADKKTLASSQSIIALADNGIAVNSENSKSLVKYLHDVENMNYERIPELKSISRLGYIDGEGFSPYVDGLIFDGDANFRKIYKTVTAHGSVDKWLQTALQVRKTNVAARIVLAASFASVLIAPVGSLPFFVHLWGGESGTGKSVAAMLAASVWAVPNIGRYIQTFDSTKVGHERLAAFLNHLPLMIDELQLAKDARGKLVFDVYALAEGVGRTRGNKMGGIEETPTWANTIITTGESPITNSSSGAGAINRVIEIECSPDFKIIEDGHAMASTLKENYGFAGREFVEMLYTDNNVEVARELYKEFLKSFSESNTTDKQAMAAAVIIVADALATEWIFKDDQALTATELSEFLQTKSSVSVGERGYRYMCDWVTQNANKLKANIEQGDVYGVVEDGRAYIIYSVFRKAADEGGFSSAALLSFLRSKGLIRTKPSSKGFAVGKRILGIPTECISMKVFNGENCQEQEESDGKWQKL